MTPFEILLLGLLVAWGVVAGLGYWDMRQRDTMLNEMYLYLEQEQDEHEHPHDHPHEHEHDHPHEHAYAGLDHEHEFVAHDHPHDHGYGGVGRNKETGEIAMNHIHRFEVMEHDGKWRCSVCAIEKQD